MTPVFNEEDTLERYVEEVTEILLDRSDMNCRVLFVDDGSTDDTWRLVEHISRDDPRFQGVRLSRNFGPHIALSAGLEQVSDDADAVATLACDLQDPPDTVIDFVKEWRDGADIVWGVRENRDDEGWRIAASRLFEFLLRRHAMPPGSKFTTGSFLLMDRKVLECFLQFRERNRITFALVAWTGFDQVRVPYHRRSRTAGESGWTFTRMVSAMYDAFTGFSTLPIRLMTIAALVAFAVGVLVSGYLVAVAALGNPVPGWTSQMLLLSVFFSVQFSLMAILGEYLHRIYAEVVGRPLFFISERTTAKNGG